MDAAIGLLGAIVGALAALGGIALTNRHDDRARRLEAVMSESAEIINLETAFRRLLHYGRLKEEREPLAGWPLDERRRAEIRLFLLHPDDELLTALTAVTVAGKEWEKVAVGSSHSDFHDLADRHFAALQAFESAARKAVSGRQSAAPGTVFVRARQTGRFGRDSVPKDSPDAIPVRAETRDAVGRGRTEVP